MNEEQNIEQSPEDGKSERPEEVNENISQQQTIKQSETQIKKSLPALAADQAGEIPKSEIKEMEVYHHPIPLYAGVKKNLKKYRKEFFIFLFLLFFHQSFTQDMHSTDITTIQSNRAASNNAIAKHDVKGIEQFWLDDFVQVIGRGTYETGKENISASWKALFNSNTQVVYIRTPEIITISDNDTMAWENGKWIGIHTYSKGGNYAAMWIKRNGNWMLKAELFVSLEANKEQ